MVMYTDIYKLYSMKRHEINEEQWKRVKGLLGEK